MGRLIRFVSGILKSEPSRAENPGMTTNQTAGDEVIMEICAWCKTVTRDGVTPATHGICPSCFKRVTEETDAAVERVAVDWGIPAAWDVSDIEDGRRVGRTEYRRDEVTVADCRPVGRDLDERD